MMTDDKTKVFIKEKLLRPSNLNPLYEKQLKHLLNLLNEYDEKFPKSQTAAQSSTSSGLDPNKKYAYSKKTSIPELPKPIPMVSIKPNTTEKNPVFLKTGLTTQKKSSSCSDLPRLIDWLSSKKPKDFVKGLTAKSWALFDATSNKYLQGQLAHFKREVASLTKIMTLYVALGVLERLDLDQNQIRITVTKEACQIGGTSAELQEGDIISVKDLFYGLMLPSGNDAAYTIGEYFGVFILMEQMGRVAKIRELGEIDLKRDFPRVKDPKRYFIEEMNEMATKLNLSQTYFNNVHGMTLKLNISTAYDIGLLTCKALKNEDIRVICRTRGYIAKIRNKEKGSSDLFWENLNRLLDEGFEGVKTGITPNAGGCLSALYRMERRDGSEKMIVVVVLSSDGAEDRFSDVLKIVDWYKHGNS